MVLYTHETTAAQTRSRTSSRTSTPHSARGATRAGEATYAEFLGWHEGGRELLVAEAKAAAAKEQWPLGSVRTHVWALVFRRHDQFNLVLEHGAAVDESGAPAVESKAGAPAAEERLSAHDAADTLEGRVEHVAAAVEAAETLASPLFGELVQRRTIDVRVPVFAVACWLFVAYDVARLVVELGRLGLGLSLVVLATFCTSRFISEWCPWLMANGPTREAAVFVGAVAVYALYVGALWVRRRHRKMCLLNFGSEENTNNL